MILELQLWWKLHSTIRHAHPAKWSRTCRRQQLELVNSNSLIIIIRSEYRWRTQKIYCFETEDLFIILWAKLAAIAKTHQRRNTFSIEFNLLLFIIPFKKNRVTRESDTLNGYHCLRTIDGSERVIDFVINAVAVVIVVVVVVVFCFVRGQCKIKRM